MLKSKIKQDIIKKSQVHEKDTGSSEVQIALLSKKIDDLAAHLKKNKKDFHSRRGLIKMVSNRRDHLKFLKRKDKAAYDSVVKKLKLE